MPMGRRFRFAPLLLALGLLASQCAPSHAGRTVGRNILQLEGNLGHVLLWEQFLRTPAEVAAPLSSVVESLAAADGVFAAWLASALERYHRASRDHSASSPRGGSS